MPTYELDYAIKRVRDAIEYAEQTNDFAPLRKSVNDLEDSIKEEDADINSKDQENTIKGILDSMHPY